MDKYGRLTNADLNPGDTVRYAGKEWRVQGIDDGDPTFGLLLLDAAEPEDSPYFVDSAFPATRGSNRRPKDGTGYRWCWGITKKAELVSRGEPE